LAQQPGGLLVADRPLALRKPEDHCHSPQYLFEADQPVGPARCRTISECCGTNPPSRRLRRSVMRSTGVAPRLDCANQSELRRGRWGGGAAALPPQLIVRRRRAAAPPASGGSSLHNRAICVEWSRGPATAARAEAAAAPGVRGGATYSLGRMQLSAVGAAARGRRRGGSSPLRRARAVAVAFRLYCWRRTRWLSHSQTDRDIRAGSGVGCQNSARVPRNRRF
jgi:hypothetical protein